MAFTLSFSTLNDAFTDDPVTEVVQVLEQAVRKLREGGQTEGKLFDTNGNRVGDFTLNTTGEERDGEDD